MIVQCERCGEEIDTETVKYRLVPAGAGLFQITRTSHTESQGSGENTSPEVAASTSRSKED